MVELRDLFDEELLDELGLDTLSGVLEPLSFPFASKRSACITGKLGASLLRSLPLVVLDPEDVGREGVDALDNSLLWELPRVRLTRKALLCLPR